MKNEYVRPELQDLGSLAEQTEALVVLGVKLDGGGGSSGSGSTFS